MLYLRCLKDNLAALVWVCVGAFVCASLFTLAAVAKRTDSFTDYVALLPAIVGGGAFICVGLVMTWRTRYFYRRLQVHVERYGRRTCLRIVKIEGGCAWTALDMIEDEMTEKVRKSIMVQRTGR